jgi:hypothetical protein
MLIATHMHLPLFAPVDITLCTYNLQGRDIWIHDCNILNDDDSIAVKPLDLNGKYATCAENILVENMVLTGFGASIGAEILFVYCHRNWA